MPKSKICLPDIIVLRRAGFFHFAQAHCDPLGELTKAMYKASRTIDVTGSLDCAAGSVQSRARLSVIEIETRRNSAYFVGAAGIPRSMCHKITDDRSQEYERCTRDCEVENPVIYSEETYIGALICADAIDNRSSRPVRTDAYAAFKRLTSLQSKLNGKRNLVCVPAYMKTSENDPAVGGSGLILANSRRNSISFIKDRNGVKIRTSECLQNHIQLEDIRKIVAE